MMVLIVFISLYLPQIIQMIIYVTREITQRAVPVQVSCYQPQLQPQQKILRKIYELRACFNAVVFTPVFLFQEFKTECFMKLLCNCHRRICGVTHNAQKDRHLYNFAA